MKQPHLVRIELVAYAVVGGETHTEALEFAEDHADDLFEEGGAHHDHVRAMIELVNADELPDLLDDLAECVAHNMGEEEVVLVGELEGFGGEEE